MCSLLIIPAMKQKKNRRPCFILLSRYWLHPPPPRPANTVQYRVKSLRAQKEKKGQIATKIKHTSSLLSVGRAGGGGVGAVEVELILIISTCLIFFAYSCPWERNIIIFSVFRVHLGAHSSAYFLGQIFLSHA
jgi:hypothetical protein